MEDEKKGEQLIVLFAGLSFDHSELQVLLAESTLPNLFQPKPTAWYEVGEVPKLGTGKVDLRGLKILAQAVVKGAPGPEGPLLTLASVLETS